MSYDPSIPATGHSASQDYGGMQANFAEIQNAFSVNHLPLASASNDGFHTLINLVAPLGGDPNQITPIGSVYTKTVSGASQLFYQNGALAANVVQLTGNLVSEGGNATVSSEYTVTTPWKLILKFGITASLASGSTVTLVSAFPTNFLGIVITPRLAGNSFCQSSANITAASTFTYTNSTGNPQNAYFFAWGN